ncbi:MAG: hypothetical protein AB7I22_20255 [Ramlibacter sp.]
MSLVIHIGTDKTGSTALQKILFSPANGPALSALNIRYVTAGLGTIDSHAHLHDTARAGNFEAWGQVFDEVKANTDIHHVISFEGLYHLGQQQWQAIRNVLPGIDIRIVIYLRRRSDLVRSGIAQLFKSGGNRPLREYTPAAMFARRQAYLPILNRAEAVFGRQAMVVRRYEKSQMYANNIYADFLRAAGADALALLPLAQQCQQQAPVNPTLNVEAIHWLDRLDQQGISKPLRRKVVRALLAATQGANTTIVPDAVAHAIDQSFEQEDRQIAATYFDAPVLFTEPSRFVHAPPDAAALKACFSLIEPILKNAETPFFDEAFYLARYPDVAKAVQEGRMASGWRHYLLYGRNEGRKTSAD